MDVPCRQRRWRGAGALALTLFLAGCAPSIEPLPGEPDEPKNPGTRLEVTGYEDGDVFPASVRAYAHDEQLVVITSGSSSCPAVPELVSIDHESQVVRLTIETWPAEMCTADMAAHTFAFDVAADLGSYTVEVGNSD